MLKQEKETEQKTVKVRKKQVTFCMWKGEEKTQHR